MDETLNYEHRFVLSERKSCISIRTWNNTTTIQLANGINFVKFAWRFTILGILSVNNDSDLLMIRATPEAWLKRLWKDGIERDQWNGKIHTHEWYAIENVIDWYRLSGVYYAFVYLPFFLMPLLFLICLEICSVSHSKIASERGRFGSPYLVKWSDSHTLPWSLASLAVQRALWNERRPYLWWWNGKAWFSKLQNVTRLIHLWDVVTKNNKT